MNPHEIRYHLALANTTQTGVARQLGIAQPNVWRTIEGLSRSKRIECRIAVITGQPLATLWPQWYGPDTQRRRRRIRKPIEEQIQALKAALAQAQADQAA